jgi:hypothetical protein
MSYRETQCLHATKVQYGTNIGKVGCSSVAGEEYEILGQTK